MTGTPRRPWTPERDKELRELVFGASSAETNPTLEEAIEACGFDFRDLSQHSKRTSESTHYRWLVKGGKRVFGKVETFQRKDSN